MKTARKLQHVMLAAMLAVLVAATNAHAGLDPDVDEDLQWAIGQVLLNTLKGHEVDGGPSTELMEKFHNDGENQIGKSWGYRANVESSKVDGQPVMVYMSITLIDESYEMTPNQKANWKKHGKGTDSETGADVAWMASTSGDVRRHRTYYRLHRDGIRMNMEFTRAGNDDADTAIKKSIDNWRSFYGYAEKQGLFESPVKLHMEVGRIDGADKEGALSNEDVLHIRKRVEKALKIPITLRIEASDLADDEKYTIALQHMTPPGFAETKLTDASGNALTDTNGDGFIDVTAAAPEDGGEATVLLHIPALDSQKSSPQSYLAGPAAVISMAHVKKNKDGNFDVKMKKEVGVQAIDWHPIVTRFEITKRTPEIGRSEGGDSPADFDAGFRDYRWSFTEMTNSKGTLKAIFDKAVYPVASQEGNIGKDQPVMLGWRKHPEAMKPEFLIAMDKPGVTEVVAMSHRSHPEVALWVEIIGPPIAEAPSTNAAGGNGGFDDMGSGTQPAPSGDTEINEPMTQETLERLIWVDDPTFVINRVYHFTAEDQKLSQEDFDEKLKEWLRLEPLSEKAKNPDRPDEELSKPVPFLQTDRPMTTFNVMRQQMLVKQKVPIRALAQTPGVYELRFSAFFYHSEEGRDLGKEQNVGIRFVILPSRFQVRTIDYDTHRLR